MRLVHLANFHSTNIGNGALIHGTEKVMAEDVDPSVQWTRAAWDDYTFGLKTFDEEFVRLVNAHDGLIIGGAVAINGRAYLTHTGMRVDLPLPLWEKIEKPVIVHGISYRHWKGQPFHHLDKLKSWVEMCLGNPRILLGVRNDGTREWLSEMLHLGDKADRLALVPDPALFVTPATDITYPELATDRPNVLLSFNDEDSEFRYANAEQRQRVIRGLAETAERLSKDFNARIVLVPHYFDDYRMLTDFVAACPPRFAHQSLVSTGLLKVDQAAYFYGRYAQADLALSMRVHSMSPSIGLSTPMVPVVTQDRMTEFLQEAGLADLEVNAFAEDFPKRLYTAASQALQNPAPLKERLRKAVAAQRSAMQTFNRQALSLLRTPH